MKKTFITTCFISLYMALSFSLAAYAKDAPSSTTLRLATHTPKMHYIVRSGFAPWAQELEKRTNGRIKVTIHPSGALGRINETYEMVRSNVVDIAFVIPSAHAGLFPICDVFEVPFLVPYTQAGRSAGEYIFKKYIAQTDFKDVKVLWFHRWSPQAVVTTKNRSETLEDMKGMRIAMPGGKIAPTFLRRLGGVPSAIPIPDIYSSLERGLVDGYIMPVQVQLAYKLFEVTKYVTLINTGSGLGVVAMNKKKWDALPADIQKVFDDLSPWAKELQLKASNKATQFAIATCKKKGLEIITPTSEEMKRWQKIGARQEPEWAKSMDSKKMPGTQIVTDVKKLSASGK